MQWWTIFLISIFLTLDLPQSIGAIQRRPDSLRAIARLKEYFGTSIQQDCYAKPCRIEGDFDGDGKRDEAILVTHTSEKKRGIAIIHGNGRAFLLGAGNSFGNGGDDFSWMDVWKLTDRNSNLVMQKDLPNPKHTNAIFVEKTGSASASIYWDGRGYRWHQRAD